MYNFGSNGHVCNISAQLNPNKKVLYKTGTQYLTDTHSRVDNTIWYNLGRCLPHLCWLLYSTTRSSFQSCTYQPTRLLPTPVSILRQHLLLSISHTLIELQAKKVKFLFMNFVIFSICKRLPFVKFNFGRITFHKDLSFFSD